MQVEDHLGNVFDNTETMCKFHNCNPLTFKDRKRKGWSIEECLYGRVYLKSPVENRTDHTGRVFNSPQEMCDFWGINLTTFQGRINKRKWSLEKALTYDPSIGNPINLEGRTDHTGKVWSSQEEMFNHYDITASTYYRYLKKGYSKEEVLLKQFDARNNSVDDRTDHNGRIFKSRRDMCRFYNIHFDTYSGRIKDGWDKERALTEPATSIKLEQIDPFGNVFDSVESMCAKYNRKSGLYSEMMRNGSDMLEALKIIPSINFKLNDFRIDNSLYVQKYFTKYNNKLYFICIYKGQEEIFEREELLDYIKRNMKIKNIS